MPATPGVSRRHIDVLDSAHARLAEDGAVMPRLRLAGRATADVAAALPQREPIVDATDPRWVLAVRVGEALQGPVLPPEKRQRLLRLGRVLGLSAFDANLVIAMVQDQARRGHSPARCAELAEPTLELIARPSRIGHGDAGLRRRRLTTAGLALAIVAIEVVLLASWLA